MIRIGDRQLSFCSGGELVNLALQFAPASLSARQLIDRLEPALPANPQPFDYEVALAACAKGDRSALQSIYQFESRRLLGVALRIVRDRALAEDVLHDAFMKIWTKAVSFDALRGTARGWIHSIVRNQALSVVRTHGREVSADEEAIEALEAERAPHAAPMTELFEINADIGRLDECLQALDAPKRNSILSAYLDGCSHSEIAAKLNAPLGSVKAWIKRGLLSLRECMA